MCKCLGWWKGNMHNTHVMYNCIPYLYNIQDNFLFSILLTEKHKSVTHIHTYILTFRNLHQSIYNTYLDLDIQNWCYVKCFVLLPKKSLKMPQNLCCTRVLKYLPYKILLCILYFILRESIRCKLPR